MNSTTGADPTALSIAVRTSVDSRRYCEGVIVRVVRDGEAVKRDVRDVDGR